MPTPLVVSEVAKSFTMHLRDGIRLPVVNGVSFSVKKGECVVLGGPSGVGKSSILKMLYGNYAVDAGQILIEHQGHMVDLATAAPRAVLEVRRDTLGYVSQFLRVVPRVSALDVVAEPLLARGRRSGCCAGEGFRTAGQAQPAARTLAVAAGHFFRRRAAARQYRPWLHHRPCHPSARRADGIAGRDEPPGGGRNDRGQES